MRSLFLIVVCCFLLAGCRSENENQSDITDNPEQDSILYETEAKADASQIEIEPISHATAVINWGETTIYLDPTGGAKAFEGMDQPDLVLITDIHGDHLDEKTLNELDLGSTRIIAPQAVQEQLSDTPDKNLVVMENGETINEQGFSIKAIAMYNLREEAKQYHEKGRGNGYVLEKDGKRVYIAGDTEDIPEMRNLKDIDIAFVPMNLPYTMPVDKAAEAVLDFAPKIVYPYHYRGQNGKADVERFRQLVNEENENIEVILAEWYPNDSSQ